MANGDRLFGPNGASGTVVGALGGNQVLLDFYPQQVTLVNQTQNFSAVWSKGMPNGSALINASGGGGSSSLVQTTETLNQSTDVFIDMVGATGFFVIGETITGSSTGATATITRGNSNIDGDIAFTPTLGMFDVGETITGGTSGTAATVATPWFFVYEPTFQVAALIGAKRTPGIDFGRPFTIGSYGVPTLVVTYDTLVGAFASGETITGGTSSNTAVVGLSLPGNLRCSQFVWGGGPGFAVGETITGGTSAATAVVTSAQYDDFLGQRAASNNLLNGAFALSFPNSINTPTIEVTYLSTNISIVGGGGGGSGTYINTGGITPGNSGFFIGDNALLNNVGDTIYWEAMR